MNISSKYVLLGVAKIEKAPKSQIVHVGDSVEFKCETSGKPNILTTWLKDGNKLQKEGCTLKIPNAKLEDQGKYTCIVRNEYGEHRCIVSLTVKGKLKRTCADLLFYCLSKCSMQIIRFYQ